MEQRSVSDYVVSVSGDSTLEKQTASVAEIDMSDVSAMEQRSVSDSVVSVSGDSTLEKQTASVSELDMSSTDEPAPSPASHGEDKPDEQHEINNSKLKLLDENKLLKAEIEKMKAEYAALQFQLSEISTPKDTEDHLLPLSEQLDVKEREKNKDYEEIMAMIQEHKTLQLENEKANEELNTAKNDDANYCGQNRSALSVKMEEFNESLEVAEDQRTEEELIENRNTLPGKIETEKAINIQLMKEVDLLHFSHFQEKEMNNYFKKKWDELDAINDKLLNENLELIDQKNRLEHQISVAQETITSLPNVIAELIEEKYVQEENGNVLKRQEIVTLEEELTRYEKKAIEFTENKTALEADITERCIANTKLTDEINLLQNQYAMQMEVTAKLANKIAKHEKLNSQLTEESVKLCEKTHEQENVPIKIKNREDGYHFSIKMQFDDPVVDGIINQEITVCTRTTDGCEISNSAELNRVLDQELQNKDMEVAKLQNQLSTMELQLQVKRDDNIESADHIQYLGNQMEKQKKEIVEQSEQCAHLKPGTLGHEVPEIINGASIPAEYYNKLLLKYEQTKAIAVTRQAELKKFQVPKISCETQTDDLP